MRRAVRGAEPEELRACVAVPAQPLAGQERQEEQRVRAGRCLGGARHDLVIGERPVVEGAPRYGFLIGWGPFLRNVAATGNVVRAAREGFAVSVVEGAGSVVIADNIIDGAERAVVGYRWADAVTGDLARGDAGRFRHLRVEKNLVS